MKNRKGLLTAILLVVLLTFVVSGTIAYLKTSTGVLVNTFQPTDVDTSIVEEFDDTKTEKTSIAVKNDSQIPVYVRVALVGNWYDDNGEIVKPWKPDFTLGSGWSKIGDYYYYQSAVNAGSTTTNLLGENVTIAKSSNAPGYEKLHLEVTVMQQAIQAEGMGATSAQDAFSKAAQAQ